MKKQLFWMLFMLLFVNACATRTASPDSKEAVYIENKGSDTMVNLALAWAEAYQDSHAGVQISVTGGGSGTGIAALLNKTVDLANASRRIKNEEFETARSNGVEPIEFVVARDAIAVIVHPQNPVNALTLQQLSDIYSGKIKNWSELGGEDRPIVRLSRESNSGTHVYFLEVVLRLGQEGNKTLFSQDTLLLPSSEGIIHEVRQNPNAIGYDGLGYVPDDLKVLAIAEKNGTAFVRPSIETVNSGAYPIARDLYIYTAGQPEDAIKKYLDWIFSDEAQKIVADLGFVPVTAPNSP
ncbi:MAG: PstS family phosphate ABC transporter substrate-binding protein [Anaerolineales bacterium]|jgi:phosphate transport system substrate-binding protein|nr:PstS family phosphate ABC transporter substrate-binding protein [Anaerolineales bacterium]